MTVYDPAPRPVKLFDACHVWPPLIEYSSTDWALVTVIEPVAFVHDEAGWVETLKPVAGGVATVTTTVSFVTQPPFVPVAVTM